MNNQMDDQIDSQPDSQDDQTDSQPDSQMDDNTNLCKYCKNAPIKYRLVLQHDVFCPYCNYLKYKKDKTTMMLCNPDCEGLYWIRDEYLTAKNAKYIEVSYGLEKDECNKCGRRDYPGAIFAGLNENYRVTPTITPDSKLRELCERCGNRPVKYQMSLQHDIVCPHCKHVKYKKHDEKLIVCSTQCSQIQWSPEKYLTAKKDKNIKVIYRIEKDKCDKCKKQDNPSALFAGINKFRISK